MGKTGLSCARFLAARGEHVMFVDTRSAPPALAAIRELLPAAVTHCGPVAKDALLGARRIIVSPGVPLDHPALVAAAACGIAIAGDVELFAQAARAPVIAITGSNGKSTVTTLVGEILAADGKRVAAGGNLGTPALDLLSDPEPDCYVLELSSFQLETTHSLAARVGAILNVSPDHLDRHKSLEAYAAAKARVLNDASVAVLNADDPIVAVLGGRARSTLTVSLEPDAPANYGVVTRLDGLWLAQDGEPVLAVSELGIKGRHNVFNALAALALTDAAGAARSAQCAVLKRFQGLPHRCNLVAEKLGVTWYDDSKGTNVGASAAAIAGIFADRQGVLIAGGQGKGADFAELAAALPDRVHTVVLIGEDAARIAAAIGTLAAVRHAGSMREAVAIAASAARPGDAVLLSPACASFDMFDDYEHRGREFVAAVAAELGS
ncbi:MAG: UDP-N-acetylmuramoyl-L-alanine--D-glutamate ligase [Gammaproteobacteria bacterium]|nr:UDP-N-acetylmuramoyl-L-alanine--D-glutamate ligase [Gammaproteobacteria bacterium]MBI5618536.1 UDP-N-acetylmuramoyl-L-alanine--D-glutamate ligase [Gammaproteobacteria bacterium]